MGDYQVDCKICCANFTDDFEYYVHANEHHNDKVKEEWFRCGHCKMYFPSPDVRELHYAEKHSVKKLCLASSVSKRLGADSVRTRTKPLRFVVELGSDSSTPKRKKKATTVFSEIEVETDGFLTCPFCDKIFSELSEFSSHVNETHSGQIKDWISCAICKNHFPSIRLREQHKKFCYEINGGESKICDFCSEILIDKFYFVQHAFNSHFDQIKEIWLPCNFCRLLFPDEETLEEHQSLAHKGRVSKVICFYCEEIFESGSSYWSHANEEHNEEIQNDNWHQCSDCSQYFPALEALKKHKHARPEEYKCCQYCLRKFTNSFLLIHHIGADHKEEVHDTWIKCDECDRLWPDDDSLSQHKSRAHRKKYSARGKRFKTCEFCDKSFCDSTEFYRHANSIHHEDVVAYGWVPCEECATFFPDDYVLKNHQIKSHPWLVPKDESLVETRRRDRAKRMTCCQFCSKTLCDSTEFYRHANHFHKEELNDWLPCDHCEMRFPDEAVIRNHKGRIHPGTNDFKKSSKKAKDNLDESKTFACKFCSEFKCTSQQAFYRHANKEHLELITESWPYCELCDLYFPTTLILERHNLKVHQGGKSLNIVCDFCNKTFPRYQHLVSHSNRLHKTEISSLWGKCKTCGMHFPNTDLLNHHLKRAHVTKKNPDEKLKCLFCPATLSTLASYYAHANDHHFERLAAGEGSWPQCSECFLFFPTKDILNNHINHRHKKDAKGPREKTKVCKFCQMKFNHPMLVYSHIAEEHRSLVEKDWHYCEKCQIFFPTKLGLTFHMLRSKHISPKVKDSCPFCSNTFKGKGKMYRHANRIHKDLLPNSPWLLCSMCSTYLPDEVTLSSHTINAHGRNFKNRSKEVSKKSTHKSCAFCQQLFSSNDEYHKHANISHKTEVVRDWVACDDCGSYLPDKKQLRLHVDCEHHPTPMHEMLLITEVPSVVNEEQIELETSEIVVEIEDGELTTEVLHCSICSETFFKPDLFYKHSNQVHLENITDSWLMCTTCKMYFPGMSVLKTHVETCHQQSAFGMMRITCTLCHEAFDRTGDFYWHANQVHTDVVAKDWFLCEDCSFFFPEWEILEQHKTYFHSDEVRK